MELLSFVKSGVLKSIGTSHHASILVSGVAVDSRKVQKGDLFVAVSGNKSHGEKYIEEALQRGARVILAEKKSAEALQHSYHQQYPQVCFLWGKEIRSILSLLASKLYPKQPLNIVAITGTNGKTSTASFIRQIWYHLGIKAASLGTLGLNIEDETKAKTAQTTLTTPDALSLHRVLQDLAENNIMHLALEASSHGLSQCRLDHLKVSTAVFTNFSSEHLDYHQTLENYFEAKLILFLKLIDEGKSAVLNADIKEFSQLYTICQQRRIKTYTYGRNGKDVQLIAVISHTSYQEVKLKILGKNYTIKLPLVGQFQVYNMIAAIAAVMHSYDCIENIVVACEKLQGIPGRLEYAAPGVYIDYAHTPDALEKVLRDLRPHTANKLRVIFGCGGERDYLKRPMMGKIASQYADCIIITDDNPRHENPKKIRKQILLGCPNALEISDRRNAIAMAMQKQERGDVLLIAGKGHETYQLLGDEIIPFNDAEEVQKSVRT